MYDLMDEACAQLLEVDTSTYIDKINRTTEMRAEIIITALFTGNPSKIEKAKLVFEKIL